ncbi:MAG: hypothetical protein H0S80_06205 [Desulfovibrionaceae bacterium]|nr:hypothetical protein [Desulfovibrionaceae bacterium]
MTVPLIILGVLVVVTLFSFRSISLNKINTLSDLTRDKQAVKTQYDYLVRRKADLEAELAEKEKLLTALVSSQQGPRIKTASEMRIDEDSEDERVSNLLLSMGKISLEENEKIKKKMDVLKMDFLTTSLALGFIDSELSQKIKKDQIRPKR